MQWLVAPSVRSTQGLGASGR